MPTTTEKRSPGRPSTKKAASPTSIQSKKKPEIKQKQSVKQYTEFVLQDKVEANAAYMITMSGITVFDKENNEVREIRYCPNEQSIYKKEQSEFAVRSPIIFVGGRLIVRRDQPNLLEFMNIHPDNVSKGGTLFKEVNKEVKANIEVKNEFLIADAVSMIRDKDIQDLLAVALSLGINVDRPVDEVKHDLLVFAKKSPKSFIDSFDNPSVEMKALIRQAQRMQVVKLDPDGVKWFDTNKLIISVPAGKKSIDVFLRYCLTESAVPVVEEMEKQLNR